MNKFKNTYLYHLWTFIKNPIRKKNYYLIEYDDKRYSNITIDRFFKDPYYGFDLSESYRYYNIISCQYKGAEKDFYYDGEIRDVYRILVECYRYYSQWEANKYYKTFKKDHKQYKKEYETREKV